MSSIDSTLYENCKAAFHNYYLGINYLINSVDELMTLLQMVGINPSYHQAKKLWYENKDSFTFNRFCQTCSHFPVINGNMLMDKFKAMDRHECGYLKREEILKMLNQYSQGSQREDVEMLLNELYFENDKFYYKKFCDDFSLTTDKLLSMMRKELKEAQTDKKESGKGIIKRTGVESSKEQPKTGSRGTNNDEAQYCLATLNIANKTSNRMFRTGRDFKKYSVTNLNGCFYYDANDVMWSHVYQLKVMKKCYAIIYISAAPRDNFTFLLVVDQQGNLVAVSSTKDQNGVYTDRLELQPETYTVVPYTIHSDVEVERDYNSATLVKEEGGHFKLSEKCLSALTKAFEKLDLNNDGYLDFLEFNFYYLLTSGDTITQEEWMLLKARGFASDLGISLHDLIRLMELELNASNGNVHDIWTTFILLGFDSSLNCRKSIPFELSCFTKNSKRLSLEVNALRSTNAELIKILKRSQSPNIQKRTLPALSDFTAYSINTDLAIIVIYDNQLEKQVHVEYNVSDSQNMQPTNSTFSGRVKIMPKSRSNGFGYLIFDNVPDYKFTSNEVLKITI